MVIADPEPNLISLVTAPFRFVGRWLTGGNSNNNYNSRYNNNYRNNNNGGGWNFYKKRSLPDIGSINTDPLTNDYTTPVFAGPVSSPMDYPGIHLMKKRSIDSLHEEVIPEAPILPSPYTSIFIHEDNLVYDTYSPFNYYENYFKNYVERAAENERER